MKIIYYVFFTSMQTLLISCSAKYHWSCLFYLPYFSNSGISHSTHTHLLLSPSSQSIQPTWLLLIRKSDLEKIQTELNIFLTSTIDVTQIFYLDQTFISVPDIHILGWEHGLWCAPPPTPFMVSYVTHAANNRLSTLQSHLWSKTFAKTNLNLTQMNNY